MSNFLYIFTNVTFILQNTEELAPKPTLNNRTGSSNGLHQNFSTPKLSTAPGLQMNSSTLHRKAVSNVSLSTLDTADTAYNNNVSQKSTINHGKPNLAPKPPSLNGKTIIYN